MINQRIFSANVGEPSTGNKGPDAIEQDIDNLLANDQELLGITGSKANLTTDDKTNLVAAINEHEEQINDLAPKVSPAFTGTPTAPTAIAGTNTTQIATTEFVKNAVDNVPSIPTNHASSGTTYGVGTTANYGHVKTINGLTQTSHVNGTALSAYQGKVLNDRINGTKYSLVRTLTINLSEPNAVAIPPSDFNDFNEFIFVIRGNVQATFSGTSTQSVIIGVSSDNNINVNGTASVCNLALRLTKDEPVNSDFNEFKYCIKTSETYGNRLYEISTNSGATSYVTTPYFKFVKSNATIISSGIAHLDIYRLNTMS